MSYFLAFLPHATENVFKMEKSVNILFSQLKSKKRKIFFLNSIVVIAHTTVYMLETCRMYFKCSDHKQVTMRDMNLLVSLIVIVILQYAHLLKYYMYHKHIFFVNYTSLKLGKNFFLSISP